LGRGSRWEYLRGIYERYQDAARVEKSRILNEFCVVAGYKRKYALRLLNAKPPKGVANSSRASRTQNTRELGGSRTAR
jgi:hypothetical protein